MKVMFERGLVSAFGFETQAKGNLTCCWSKTQRGLIAMRFW